MTHALTPQWTDTEIARLDEFLSRDDGPVNAMSASMLDGYLCAVVSAPNLIMPGEMLRWVWDTENGQDEPAFASNAQATDILNLIMRQWNAINDALTAGPQVYAPLLGVNQHDGHDVILLDDWCEGYDIAMQLDLPSWTPLLMEKPQWFSTILRYGTAEGDEALMGQPFDRAKHQAAADALLGQVHAIHAHNLSLRLQQPAQTVLSQRTMGRPQPLRRAEPKMGRNDPCHCGSGRKYKHCHGAN